MRYTLVRAKGPIDRSPCVVLWLLLAVAVALVVICVVIIRYEESCIVSMQLNPTSGCTARGCDARIGDIRFDNENCSERSTTSYCYLDVTQCLLSTEPVCLQKELLRGVRVFFVDVHMKRDGQVSCTRWCMMHAMTVEDMLSIFNDFLHTNPREVLILWWFPQGEKQSIVYEIQRLYSVTGLSRYSFISNHSEWPTISELIVTDKRLVSLSNSPGVNSYEVLQADDGGLDSA